MSKLLEKGLIQIKPEAYLELLIIVAPILNFIAGITLTLFSASLPAIASYYHASIVAAKNTITASMIGFALGSILFGALLDSLGRRRVILMSLLIYIVASLVALICNNIEQLILICLIQGMMVAAVSIGPRALLSDNFTGHRFQVGLLYTSIAYGLGPIIGPFIGGILEYHFGWKANFLVFTISAIVVAVIVFLYINESLVNRMHLSLKSICLNYVTVLKHPIFMAGVIIGGCCQFELMVYSAVGPFIVENVLHLTPIVYGNTALLVSGGYLIGTLTNRILMKHFQMRHLTDIGFALLIIGLLLQLVFALMGQLNLFTLILPISIICLSNGFIFPNVLGPCLKLFPQSVGMAMAVFTCILMAIGALGIFIISHINIQSVMTLLMIFASAALLQIVIFCAGFRRAAV